MIPEVLTGALDEDWTAITGDAFESCSQFKCVLVASSFGDSLAK
jgi:hypothetical protein